ncbi:serine hydrolase domain-containing protein [Microbacterium murale]|uniref:CubicO group peptidase (Beta-lactamase class C family) n=1 Tax=Microbacterium murale TaxID=1081040 RepID=A0ABU0P7X7_9MICO|nr:serine hydrolase domain-containing protein [Microbacterium murale]MDQ0643438.1 CubicO group peptidase (beta-lactamase class C family) [Microbacterium murale]
MTPLSPTAFDPAPWDHLLAEIARRHHVPGIVAGVLSIDEETGRESRLVARTGVTNNRTGVATDRDTVCQVGSITKVATATMIMQLREEGKLDLDTPVLDLLPGVELDSPHASELTVKHLITHTSGIDGDLFTDTGRGDDCVEKYVATLKSADALFAPSAGWSYCNSGFVLAGRIIEVLDGRTWDASLRARITGRLELDTFLTLPEEVMAHRYQHGHVRAPGTSSWVPAPVSSITRSMGPAGLISSTVDDLLSFGGAFVRGGRTRDGARLVSDETVEMMTQSQWALDPAAAATAPEWGLGWMLDDWGGHRMFWHGGTTIGNNAWLQVLPDDGLVFVVFCNGGVAPYAAAEVYEAFAREFSDAVPTSTRRPSGPAADAVLDESWLGTYADASTSLVVERADDGGVQATVVVTGVAAPPEPPKPFALFPRSEPDQFVGRPDPLTPWAPVSFTTIEDRPVAYVGIRALPRCEQAAS